MEEQRAQPAIRMSFVYNYCNDIAAIRTFYVELLGMTEKSYRDTEQAGWLNVDGGGFDFMYFRAPDSAPRRDFASQPGDGGGSGLHASWSVQVPETFFAATVRRLRAAQVRAMTPVPTWRQGSYWGYTVMDPAGNTVEVFTAPKTKPASTEWLGE